jgi:hypothetical protein
MVTMLLMLMMVVVDGVVWLERDDWGGGCC